MLGHEHPVPRPRFEIHGGGADLAFPHHESEIAQSEGATGEQPFVAWWMHAGMLRFADEKMSKSLGNLVLVRDLLASYPGDAIRHYLVSHHYRQEISYDESEVEASALAAARLRQACRVAEEIEPLAPALAEPATLDPLVPSIASASWRPWTTTWTPLPPCRRRTPWRRSASATGSGAARPGRLDGARARCRASWA